MSRTRERIGLGVVLVLCGVLFAERLTGEIRHAVLGMFLIGVAAVHICRHYAKTKYQKSGIQLVNQVMLSALLVLFVTGMLLHPLQGVLVLKLLHKLSAVLLILGMIGHVIQHRA